MVQQRKGEVVPGMSPKRRAVDWMTCHAVICVLLASTWLIGNMGPLAKPLVTQDLAAACFLLAQHLGHRGTGHRNGKRRSPF